MRQTRPGMAKVSLLSQPNVDSLTPPVTASSFSFIPPHMKGEAVAPPVTTKCRPRWLDPSVKGVIKPNDDRQFELILFEMTQTNVAGLCGYCYSYGQNEAANV